VASDAGDAEESSDEPDFVVDSGLGVALVALEPASDVSGLGVAAALELDADASELPALEADADASAFEALFVGEAAVDDILLYWMRRTKPIQKWITLSYVHQASSPSVAAAHS
jgi:hypothetical protein